MAHNKLHYLVNIQYKTFRYDIKTESNCILRRSNLQDISQDKYPCYVRLISQPHFMKIKIKLRWL